MKPGEAAYRSASRQREWRSGLLIGGVFALLLIGAEWFGRAVATVLGVPTTMFSEAIVLRIAPVLSFGLLLYWCSWHAAVGTFASGKSASWLRVSPWLPNRRLPLYPSVLPLRHGLMVALSTASIALYSPRLAWLPIFALLAALMIRVVILNLLSGKPGPLIGSVLLAWGALLGIPLAAKFVFIGIAVALLLLGTRRFARGFTRIEPAPAVALFRGHPGWLLRQAPKIETTPSPRGVGILLGAVVFWLIFCPMQGLVLDPANRRALTFFAGVAVLLVSLGRWIAYVSHDAAPISMIGRLQRGPLVIPSHDRVIIAPLASLAVTGMALAACMLMDASSAFTVALLPALAIAICVEIGPSLRSWRLTGRHNSTRAALREISVRTSVQKR